MKKATYFRIISVIQFLAFLVMLILDIIELVILVDAFKQTNVINGVMLALCIVGLLMFGFIGPASSILFWTVASMLEQKVYANTSVVNNTIQCDLRIADLIKAKEHLGQFVDPGCLGVVRQIYSKEVIEAKFRNSKGYDEIVLTKIETVEKAN